MVRRWGCCPNLRESDWSCWSPRGGGRGLSLWGWVVGQGGGCHISLWKEWELGHTALSFLQCSGDIRPVPVLTSPGGPGSVCEASLHSSPPYARTVALSQPSSELVPNEHLCIQGRRPGFQISLIHFLSPSQTHLGTVSALYKRHDMMVRGAAALRSYTI